MSSYLPDVAVASRAAVSPDAGTPAGTVAVRACGLRFGGGRSRRGMQRRRPVRQPSSSPGIFPALIALTPARIGERQAQHVIAWQVGAAAAGGAGISALIGLLIGTTSLAILGPSITVLAMLLAGAELILARLAPAGRS